MTRILLIEDETILAREVMEWLTLEGYDVMRAEDGIAGVEAAFRHCPDLIICDITMPRLDGHGVLLELRSNLATANIPFIFVTARASYEDIRQGMAMGADDYITKPFTRLELLEAVQTRLDKKAIVEHKFQGEVHQLQAALAQEHERLMLKAKLVAMYSHDFRNPLSIIMSSNSLLRDYTDRLDDKRRLMHFNRVEGAVRQLMQMLDDMLVVAQMETGNLDFSPALMNVGELLGGIVDEFQAIHSETHHIVYENRLKEPVMTDPRLLHQIAGNLISNAIKYSPKDSQVTILLERQKGQYSLTVKDQGIGIPESDQERLFHEFQRASNVGAVPGTGLGLAIVKQAVDLHGGSIELTSESGMGTTVTVRIPG
jgi:two-component system, sensor histidine kinase and response regulator